MKINIIVDETLKETEVLIKTPVITDEITGLAEKISGSNKKTLKVFLNSDYQTAVSIDDVIRVYSAVGKVFVVTSLTEYTTKSRIYELEEELSSHEFLRISSSEIINLSKVKAFDLSFPKTIGITMSNNQISYVSRRYVNTVKPYLMPREKAEDYPLIINTIGPFINVVLFDENLIEDFTQMGFSKYEFDFKFWKDNQYAKRLDDFSPEIIDKWISYFISLGGIFIDGKNGSPKDLLFTAINKGNIKVKEVFTMSFLSDGKYSINREKTSKATSYDWRNI